MSYFFYYHYNYWNNYENVIVFIWIVMVKVENDINEKKHKKNNIIYYGII